MAPNLTRGGWIGLLAICVACSPRQVARRAPAEPIDIAMEPAPPPTDVPGAAELVRAELPEEVEALTARITPRVLNVPNVRPGRAAGFSIGQDRRGWVTRLPEPRMRLLTPSFGAGHVFVGGGFGSHRLYALDPTSGAVDWMAAAPDGGPTAAITLDDKVLFNTESCTLFVLDAETGRERWRRWLGDPLMSQPAAANGRVFSGHVRDQGGYGFTAMDLDTGRVLWTRNISADVMNAPVLDETSVYFTTMDGVVWRFEQESGRRVWRQRIRATSAPWRAEDGLYVTRRERVEGGPGEKLVRLSLELGETVEEHDAVAGAFVRGRPDRGGVENGWAYEGSRPTLVDGRLYQTIGNEVHSRDAETGELLWRRRYAHEVRHRPATPPAIAGGQLVFGTREGVVYGLDIDTGLTTFAYDVGQPIAAQPTVAGGWVFASTTRGRVVGLEVADASMGGWHMWGGDARHNGPVDEPVSPIAAASDDDGPTGGTLRLRTAPTEGEPEGFALASTDVRARVSEFVARVRVEQTFDNPYDHAIEAVYLFPLPDDAAVDAMELRAGARRITGQIRERSEAVREYRAARERGAMAALLEQERPNLFRQSVANIPAGESVRVVLEYSQALPYVEGSYRFRFPMVAGSRREGAPAQAAGEGTRDVVTVGLQARLGGTLRGVSSPTHAIRTRRLGDRSALVALRTVAPREDLEVRLAVSGDEPSVSVLGSAPQGERLGALSLLVHPRLDVPAEQITPRELVLVLDTSSSMNGRPFAHARAAAMHALEGLRETDTFRIVRFSDRASELSEAPLFATAENLEHARAHLEGMRALGTTEMRRGLHTALSPAIDDDRMRVALLVTDGYIGNEAEVLREVEAALGQSRVFALGVGASVNRYLLSRLTELGRGELSVVSPSESPEEAADAFLDHIESPYLTDVRVDWGELGVRDVYPRRAPDLYADRPLVLHGRYAEGGTGEVTIRGRVAGRAFVRTIRVTLPEGSPARPEVGSLWARARVRDLMNEMSLRPSDALRETITRVGLEHSLMTQWTAFVAVDEGEALPNGVDYGGEATRVGSMSGGMALGGVGAVMGSGVGYGMAASGYGSAGTVGYGSGSGGVMARRAVAVPRIRMGTAEIRGSLSREVIRRVVRRQMGALRFCYEQRLATSPELEGRVTVSAVVSPVGEVRHATIANSTLNDDRVETCVLGVFQRMRFPSSPGSGFVMINYPLVFEVPESPPYAPGLPRPIPL